MTNSTTTNSPASAPAGPAMRSGAITPVIPGFYPDPTVCKVGDDYYLANSSFEYFPGAPIFHSTDLVSWTQIGNILDRRTQFHHGTDRPSTGIYGSTLRFHVGRLWFSTSNVSDFQAVQLIVKAVDPADLAEMVLRHPGVESVDRKRVLALGDGQFL